jgi:membrane protein required for beta-lactamase induction
MHFPALLTALFIDRVLWNASERRNFDWLRDYLAWWQRRSWFKPAPDSRWQGLAPILPPLVLVAWLQTSLAPAFGPLIEFALGTLVLLFSLGPRDLGRDVEEALSAMAKGDSRTAEDLADSLFSTQAGSASATERVRDGLLIAICHRYIGPVFWFALLGPVGAAGYRLTEQIGLLLDSEEPIANTGARLFTVLNWVPVRLTAAGFAIAGNFDAVAAAWKHCTQNENECPRDSDLLLATGRAALESHLAHDSSLERVEDAMALGWRNLTLWVAIVGVASLLSAL